MASRDLPGVPTITAVLGPTNTGKTHRAIQRMLGHGSGLIGLPLRLLAREVYDKVCAVVGPAQVALLTGEEKRVPQRPRYWICTTESMPLTLPVDFVAVDEIQLAAHRERGHTFTDRILNLRGLRETWLLGSDTMAPLLEELVPTAVQESHPRMSRLSWGGVSKLGDLPPRSAVVAFSLSQLYEIAERIRARRGGVALVMGALSPRTRNAQVAMYQSGEVQHLVATDAIGMGLNMDVDHVAFAATQKFDGKNVRPLDAAELAQIAGRAGRYRRDGTFGTLSDCPELPAETISAIESHTFSPIRRIYWRNTELDLSSIDALLRSLHRQPRRRCFVQVDASADLDALQQLTSRPDLRGMLRDPAGLSLLWEVCRIPDFRNTLPEVHLHLLDAIFRQLRGPKGALDTDWMRERIDQLDRVDGEIENLMTRIAWIRTWTYITQRATWVPDALSWQARTREIEDRLSDALHDQLTRRFVDHRALAIGRERSRGGSLEVEVDAQGKVSAAGHVLGTLEGLDFHLEGDAKSDQAILKAARGALGPLVVERLEAILRAPDEDLSWDAEGWICQGNARLARLEKGQALDQPQISLARHELLDSAGRGRLHERLTAWIRGEVGRLFQPLDRVDEVHLKNAARAIRHALRENLGLVWREPLGAEIKRLTPMDQKNLPRMDVRVGTALVYVESLLKPEKVRLKAVLFAAWRGIWPLPPLPPSGAISIPASELSGIRPGEWAMALGFVPVGPRALRADICERFLMQLRQASREVPFAPPTAMPSWLGCSRAELFQMIEAVGYPPNGDGTFFARPSRRPARRGPPPRRRPLGA
jgi:ATP-dependent RNA helicase SUPV3L1/SUV3